MSPAKIHPVRKEGPTREKLYRLADWRLRGGGLGAGAGAGGAGWGLRVEPDCTYYFRFLVVELARFSGSRCSESDTMIYSSAFMTLAIP